MVDDVRKRPDDELNFTEGTEEVRCVAESADFHLIVSLDHPTAVHHWT